MEMQTAQMQATEMMLALFAGSPAMRVHGRHLLHPAIFHAMRTFTGAANIANHVPAKPQLPKRMSEVTFKCDAYETATATGITVEQPLVDRCCSSQNQEQGIHDLISASTSSIAMAALALNHSEVDRLSMLSASPSFEQLFGYSRQELLGKNATRLLCDGHLDPSFELHLELASSSLQRPGVLPVTLRRKTGELVDSLVLIKKLKTCPDMLLVLYVDRMAYPNAEEQLLAQAKSWDDADNQY
ncbi:unnamed protein product [Symbiodinium microadriaticum]|nr:unnamed protein product [Symbiodinium microadriaticum]CAE7369027.1 unnamed protein product [Symbiodinium sp. KB8]